MYYTVSIVLDDFIGKLYTNYQENGTFKWCKMNKMKFILTVSFLLTIISCDTAKKDDLRKAEVFQFPHIVDRYGNETLELSAEDWINFSDCSPLYIGKLSDTIHIERNLRPLSLFHPPVMDSLEWNYDQDKGVFNKYFLDWTDSREYKDIDSVDLWIKIDTTQIINNYGRKAFPVLIQNESLDTIRIGYGNQIPLITEAKSQNGEWKPIEKKFVYRCGNGLHTIILPPKESLISSEIVYDGDFKTKLRIKVGNIYSEEYEGNINTSQFESELDMLEKE